MSQGATELADLFGGETGGDVDKFERTSWSPGPGGAPVLDECENWFAARITFHRAQMIEPGHEG